MSFIDELLFFKGLLVPAVGRTLTLWITSLCISLGVGIPLGIVRAREIAIPWLGVVLGVGVLVLRGVPLYAQLMMNYFVVPELTGIALSPFVTGMLTLGICSAAYVSEIVRAGVNTLDQGQWDAARVLGYSPWQCVRYIVAPQALQNVWPSLANEALLVCKSTALIGAIGVMELTKISIGLIARTGKPLVICALMSTIYLGLAMIVWAVLNACKKVGWLS